MNLFSKLNAQQAWQKVSLGVALQSLSFGRHFNQSLEHAELPDGLQSLVFGHSFNQPLENVCLVRERDCVLGCLKCFFNLCSTSFTTMVVPFQWSNQRHDELMKILECVQPVFNVSE